MDLKDLEEKLKECQNARFKIIVTDGVFSMEGIIANIKGIAALADKYDCIFMVDESHATGVIGKKGIGSIEHQRAMGSAEIITSTLGKALGGGNGGFITGKKEIISLLRQKARHYLFSNALPASSVEANIEAFKILTESSFLLEKLASNIRFFRNNMKQNGFFLLGHEESAICPVLLKGEREAVEMSAKLFERGIMARAIVFPVVGKGMSRIRVQISADHEEKDISKGVDIFKEVGKELKIIN